MKAIKLWCAICDGRFITEGSEKGGSDIVWRRGCVGSRCVKEFSCTRIWTKRAKERFRKNELHVQKWRGMRKDKIVGE